MAQRGGHSGLEVELSTACLFTHEREVSIGSVYGQTRVSRRELHREYSERNSLYVRSHTKEAGALFDSPPAVRRLAVAGRRRGGRRLRPIVHGNPARDAGIQETLPPRHGLPHVRCRTDEAGDLAHAVLSLIFCKEK